jgi:hypothetical protein
MAILFVKDGRYYTLPSKSLKMLTENGWPIDVEYPLLSQRDLATLTLGGVMTVSPNFSRPGKKSAN